MLTSFGNIGILNSQHYTCQRLEAPDIPEASDATIPQLTTESTMQLPIGAFSALSEMMQGNLKSVEMLILTVLGYRSNWDSGRTWKSSLRKLAELTGISVRYLRDTLSGLMTNGWISVLSVGTNTGSRYEITHHNCSKDDVPTDKHGNALKFAIPHGTNGILERLFCGDICWKCAIIWIVMKLRSDWQTGITHRLSIKKLQNWVGMSPQTVVNCIKELTKAGLIKRISKRHEASVFQLYPKPDQKPKPVYRKPKPKKDQTVGDKQMRADGDYRYSFNELWRINVESGQIQRRKSRRFGIWRNTSEHERHTQMPKSMKSDFDKAYYFYQRLKVELGVTDTAQCVTDTAQSVTHTAQQVLPSLFACSDSKGSQTG